VGRENVVCRDFFGVATGTLTGTAIGEGVGTIFGYSKPAPPFGEQCFFIGYPKTIFFNPFFFAALKYYTDFDHKQTRRR